MGLIKSQNITSGLILSELFQHYFSYIRMDSPTLPTISASRGTARANAAQAIRSLGIQLPDDPTHDGFREQGDAHSSSSSSASSSSIHDQAKKLFQQGLAAFNLLSQIQAPETVVTDTNVTTVEGEYNHDAKSGPKT